MDDRRRILVVDDQESMRSLLKDMLEVIGYEVALAEGGEEALRLMQASQFDLVLTDLNMPGMDGTALLRAIKANKAELPVVIITGYGTFHTEKRVMREGANGYISKPCTLTKIESTLSSVFSAKI
ncbi:MAG: response regulator [Candidatus Eisenbacteria bacterium]|jgi:DNA-binding NtrC family response regulator